MGRWAQINENNVVTNVVVASNQQWLMNKFGGTWVETFSDGGHRINAAGPGMLYSPEKDAFYESCPFESWSLNEETFTWEPPVPKPEGIDEVPHTWDEETLSWVYLEES